MSPTQRCTAPFASVLMPPMEKPALFRAAVGEATETGARASTRPLLPYLRRKFSSSRYEMISAD